MGIRSDVIHVPITVTIDALAQDNGDGTWTAIASLGGRSVGPITGETRDEALSLVADLASIDTSGFVS